jgi:hypothetical protein
MTSTVPPGRSLSASLSRHFVPGYYRADPPGQKPCAIEAPRRIILALMGLKTWAKFFGPFGFGTALFGLKTRH